MRALRSRLGLDSGHASRLLRSLEGAGLVEVTAGAADRRARTARLTRQGSPSARCVDRRQRRARQLVPRAAGGRPARAARRRDARGRAAPHGRPRRDPGRSTRRIPTRASACARTSPSSTAARRRPSTRRRARPPSRTSSGRPPASCWSPTSAARRSAAARSSTTPARRPTSSACGSPSRPAGSGSGGGSWRSSRRGPPSTAPASVRMETNARADRGDRALPLRGLRRGAGLQRRALRAPLVREDAPVAIHQGGLMHNVIRAGELRRSRGGTITFEGEPHGSGVSFFLVDSEPGAGPGLHRHPYAETWIIQLWHGALYRRRRGARSGRRRHRRRGRRDAAQVRQRRPGQARHRLHPRLAGDDPGEPRGVSR